MSVRELLIFDSKSKKVKLFKIKLTQLAYNHFPISHLSEVSCVTGVRFLVGSYYQLYCSTINFKVVFSSETFRGRGPMKGIAVMTWRGVSGG